MINILDKADCCGCSACASICPTDAIEMKPDTLGFLFPVVDSLKCIGCGRCEKVCAFNDYYDMSANLSAPLAYAVRHKSINEVETSRSGAAFIALSDYILGLGGVVYGAGYTDHFRVIHKRATSKTECKEFKGSKYTQSDMGIIFKQVRTDLRDGKLVLFSGTPCQTSGLSSFIDKKLREHLLLVDIVCHGVPSPYFWRDYLHYMERKVHKIFTSVDFRDKAKFGWAAHFESFKADSVYISTSTFRELFYKHIILRTSCSKCHFTNTRRPSDITLADFWGWEKTDKSFNSDDKGCSLVLVNTEKGKEVFSSISNSVNYISADLKNCMQPALEHPFPAHKDRSKFEKYYNLFGFKFVLLLYGNVGPLHKLRSLKNRIIELFTI